MPNALTGYRLFVAGPVVFMLYGWEYAAEHGYAVSMAEYIPYRMVALYVVLAGAISEFLDGFLARRYAEFGWMTDFGRDLDPWADKAFGVWCLPPLVMHLGLELYLIYVVIPVLYVFYYSFRTQWMRRKKMLLGASKRAKWKTAVLMAAQVIAYLAFAVQPDGVALSDTTWASLIFTIAMFATAIGAVLCYFALEEYEENIREQSSAIQPAE